MSDDRLEAKTGSGAVNRPRLQHYVPQFLLRRFTDSAGRLGVFDKAADRSFSTGTRAVAAEAFFYDVELDGDVLTLEPTLAELERVASGVIDQIHTRQSLSHLTSKDRGTLAAFIAVQAFRTQHQRANILHLARSLVDRINRAVPDDQPEATLPSPTEEDARRIAMHLNVDASRDIALIIASKPWVLARARHGDLYIGDNPVALHNDRDFGVYGSTGYAVRGVEIHFPLGPELTLFIPCPSTIQQARDVLTDLETFRALDPVSAQRFDTKVGRVRDLVRAVDHGSPIQLEPENVERENSLQVAYAGRWLFSMSGDFELARRMIAEHPSAREGPFGTVH